MNRLNFLVWAFLFVLIACNSGNNQKKTMSDNIFTGTVGEVKLITLDPGHFHAALVQKVEYNQVNPLVNVYAPDGPDVTDHMNRIKAFNQREKDATNWETIVYKGPDFLDRMLLEKPGNLLVLAGNNRKKTEYIKKAVQEGINVLADKPMAINTEDFELLKEAFIIAEKNNVLLYDIMTERHEITTMLQKELAQIPDIFGKLLTGSLENPSVTKESVHHFFKYVSGNKIKRPAWFFDVSQEGDGIVDVTTHLVDLIQWECFPCEIIDYKNDITMIKAKRWATELHPSEFNTVTRLSEYPDYLKKYLTNDSILNVYSNGEMNYKIKGIHAKVSVIWNYKAPEGGGDSHYSILRGSRANLIIKQGAEQNYKASLFIEPVQNTNLDKYEIDLKRNVNEISEKFPGVKLVRKEDIWQLEIPDRLKIGHEAHFGQVTEKFLKYLIDGKLPYWEVPNMIAKYYTTTQAFELAKKTK